MRDSQFSAPPPHQSFRALLNFRGLLFSASPPLPPSFRAFSRLSWSSFRSPEESMAMIEMEPGYRLELVAAEPMA